MKPTLLSVQFPVVIFAIAVLLIAATGCSGERQRISVPTPSVLLSPTGSRPTTVGSKPGTDPGTPFSVSGTAVPFRSLAKSFKLGGNLPQPTLLMAADEESSKAVALLIDPRDQAFLKDADFQRDALLAVFWGTKPSGGFSITVNGIFVSEDEVTVSISLQENDPTFPRIEASTLPYHLVTVARDALPENKVIGYRLVDGNKTLATGQLR